MKGNIDIISVERLDGISIQVFPITKQAEAEALAKEMTDYHGRPYVTKITNVPKIMYPHLSGVE